MFDLTDEQEAIVQPKEWSSAIVVAKAGSGKTTTIIQRAINQAETITDWKSLAIISFTNKSVEDIRERLKHLNAKNIISMTFHAFLINHILSFIPLFRNKNIPFDFKIKVNSPKEWIAYIKENNKIPISKFPSKDYLLGAALYALNNFPYIQKYLKCKFTAIYIDEAQDNNKLQYEIIKILLDLGIQVVLVGDEHQTIYQFRGASAKEFLEMQEHPKFSKNIYRLTKNFRCNKYIDAYANSYVIPIEDKKDKNKNGVFVCKVNILKNIIDHFSKKNQGVCFLFRGVNGISYTYNQKIINDYSLPLIKQPDILVKSNDPYPLDLLFKMFFGDFKEELKFIENILPNLQYKKAKQIIKALKDHPSKETLTKLNECANIYDEQDFDEIIETFNSYDAKEFYTLNSTKICAMTIHSAKGLEFKNVVVMTRDFRELNSTNNSNTKELFYVACTRAQEKLIFIN